MFADARLSEGVDCPPRPPQRLIGWWYQDSGHPVTEAATGRGISIGLIDTGIGPHPALAHVASAGAFIDGRHDPDAPIDDVRVHGSSLAGLIGTRLVGGTAPARGGGAPGARLIGACVYASTTGGVSSADVALAIDHPSSVEKADIINLSVMADKGSDIVKGAIATAAHRGTICIAAAGNVGQTVLFPVAFDESVAITPIGRAGWAPSGSVSAQHSPDDADLHAGGLFAANFACHFAEVDLCAGGVGVVTTVPTPDGGGFAASDGRSLAAPVVCGAVDREGKPDQPGQQPGIGGADPFEKTHRVRDHLMRLAVPSGSRFDPVAFGKQQHQTCGTVRQGQHVAFDHGAPHLRVVRRGLWHVGREPSGPGKPRSDLA